MNEVASIPAGRQSDRIWSPARHDPSPKNTANKFDGIENPIAIGSNLINCFSFSSTQYKNARLQSEISKQYQY
jgi:hypothetical protein